MAKNDDHPAKQAVIKEWDDWASKHGEDVVGDGMLFFGYLQRDAPICCSILSTRAINGRSSIRGC
jgi:hypothetical protein